MSSGTPANPAGGALGLWPALFCAGMLAACAGSRPLQAEFEAGVENELAAADMPTTHLEEPRPDELVVVINNNSGIGNHAGLFLGRRLSDPAGSYRFIRAQTKGWKRPTLNDYIGYQLADGERIQNYRFTLPAADRSAIAARLPAADAAAPLFCAAAVNNALAGIGPFAKLAPVGWMSPAATAEQLDAILAANPGVGHCVLPDNSPCTPPVQLRASVPR